MELNTLLFYFIEENLLQAILAFLVWIFFSFKNFNKHFLQWEKKNLTRKFRNNDWGDVFFSQR